MVRVDAVQNDVVWRWVGGRGWKWLGEGWMRGFGWLWLGEWFWVVGCAWVWLGWGGWVGGGWVWLGVVGGLKAVEKKILVIKNDLKTNNW